MVECGNSLPRWFIANPLIGTQQAYPVRYGFAYEALKCASLEIANDAGDDITFAADSADNGSLPRTDTAGSAPASSLSLCLFLASPPTKVSSTSTIPPSFSISSISATRTLWHISQAVL